MKTYPNGHRYTNYDTYGVILHQPYDYEKHGLIQRWVSHKIAESKNIPLQAILKFVDKSFVHILKYIDELKYFKNYLRHNR